MMKQKPVFLQQLLSTVGTNLAVGGIGVATGVLASRLLGPTGRGELAAIQLWASFLTVFAMAGLPESMTYYSAKNRSRAASYLSSAILLSLVLSTIVLVTGYLLVPFGLHAQMGPTVRAAQLYLLLVPISAIISIANETLRGCGFFRLWNILRILPASLWLATLLDLWLAGNPSPSAAASGYLLALALLVPIVLFVVTRNVGKLTRPDKSMWMPLLRFGLPTTFAAVPSLLNLRMDQLIMAAVLTATDLGVYAVAVSWSMLLAPVLRAVGMVLFPKIASTKQPGSQVEMLALASRLSLLVALLVGTIIVLITPMGLPILFGTEFMPSVTPAMLLVYASVITNMNFVLEEGARGMGHPIVPLKAEVVGLLITAGTLAIFLPRFGVVGAALASISGYGAVGIVLLVQLSRLVGISPLVFLIPRRQDLTRAWSTALHLRSALK